MVGFFYTFISYIPYWYTETFCLYPISVSCCFSIKKKKFFFNTMILGRCRRLVFPPPPHYYTHCATVHCGVHGYFESGPYHILISFINVCLFFFSYGSCNQPIVYKWGFHHIYNFFNHTDKRSLIFLLCWIAGSRHPFDYTMQVYGNRMPEDRHYRHCFLINLQFRLCSHLRLRLCLVPDVRRNSTACCTVFSSKMTDTIMETQWTPS